MKGRIYKIVNTQNEKFYIGSTHNEIRVRWQQHRWDYTKWVNGKHHGCSLYTAIKEVGDVKSFRIMLIKEYDVVDRAHMEAYETLWINKFWQSDNLLNKIHPFSIRKLTKRLWRSENRDRLTILHRKYREEHKEIILAREKKYREEHKKSIAAYKRQLREKVKLERMKRREEKEAAGIVAKKDRILCKVCNSEVLRATLRRHKRTRKHISALNITE